MRRSKMGVLVLASLLAGCAKGSAVRTSPAGVQVTARPVPSPDPLVAAARSLLSTGCDTDVRGGALEEIAALPTWPASTPRVAGAGASPAFDVVMYTAHPDDEAMYAGGTMDLLVRAGRRVAFVAMSHGEGGRLLERGLDGGIEERRDYPRTHVAAVRDREIAVAAGTARVDFAHLYPVEANVDDTWTTSCAETLSRWDTSLPGGVAGALRRLVVDVRARRPRVVITLDSRDDPQGSHHGHHKAVGVLANAAARLAADPRVVDGEQLHVVEELLTTAPRGTPADVTVTVDVGARMAMLHAYGSQFIPEQLAIDPIALRETEQFVLRWRAERAPPAPEGSRLLALLRPEPAAR